MTNIVLAAQAAGQGSGMSMIIMMVAIFAIMWFFMIKPQQKKQKEIQKFQNELTGPGQKHRRREDCPRRRRHRREDLCLQGHVKCPLAEISTDRYGDAQTVANHQRLPV